MTQADEDGSADAWRAYDGHQLDELEARWRANGPTAPEPALQALAAALAAIVPAAQPVPLGRRVFTAIREAERDERAAGELRERAREELASVLAAIDRLRAVASDADGIGLSRIAALLDHRGETEAAQGLDDTMRWLRSAGAATLNIEAARNALNAQGGKATPVRRLADRLVPLFAEIAGRPAAVTRNSVTGETSGRFVELVAAAVALSGIRAQPSEIGNAARGAVQAIRSAREAN
ncbi:MAG: hypothetical protein JNM13_04940 [Hyphomicrobiaceae bacterium]|nr:hypothetical protein [Hyphomicrobiaceae bacterium]